MAVKPKRLKLAKRKQSTLINDETHWTTRYALLMAYDIYTFTSLFMSERSLAPQRILIHVEVKLLTARWTQRSGVWCRQLQTVL